MKTRLPTNRSAVKSSSRGTSPLNFGIFLWQKQNLQPPTPTVSSCIRARVGVPPAPLLSQVPSVCM